MQVFIESRPFKMAAVFALILGVMAAGLWGGRNSALASEGDHQTFMVMAGTHGDGNVEVMAFGPSVLKVHQGDTVMWHINSFHNVHFEDQPIELVIFPVVDGKPLPQINPAAALPTIADGGSYSGGEANNGLPAQGTIGTFSLVIDAPVGRYMYLCDVHPGMVGVIEVVPDDQAIPSPQEASEQGNQELTDSLNAGYAILPTLQGSAPVKSEDGVLTITTGSGSTGRATVKQFNSFVGVVQAGDTVTWANPADSIEPHFVNALPYDPAVLPDLIPQVQPNGPPVLALGPGFLGTTQSGVSVKAGDNFNSSFIMPGQSFSLKFDEPGVYDYECHIHPNMRGVIVVESKT